MKSREKTRRAGLAFTVIGGVIAILLLFGVVVMTVGYFHLTGVLTTRYQEMAKNTAETAAALLDADSLDAYVQSGGSAYQTFRERMGEITDEQEMRIYVVLEDDKTFVFDTSRDADDAFVPGTQPDMTSMSSGDDAQSGIIRQRENGQTKIISWKDLIGSDGTKKGVLRVEYEMQILDETRRQFIGYMMIVTAVLTALTVVLVWLFFSRRLIRPIGRLTKEAERFARETSRAPSPLTDGFSRIRELNTLAVSLDAMENDTLQNIDRLTAATVERERIGTELHVAKKIQTGLLPATFPPYPDRTEFDIYAFMQPAKEIGGDFYDFFLQDDDHLALVIADVSGKGIPAALFMTAAKVSIQVCAMNGGTPAQILTKANTRIYENNAEDMFVTVWLGILELSTGKLLYANAGHEDPVFCRGGQFRLEKSRHGFVLGAMPDTQYCDAETVLTNGDALFLYTDGVSDAMNPAQQMFGLSALEKTLNGCGEKTAQERVDAVQNAVQAFTDGAPQFDDITMLCLCYSKKEAENLQIPAQTEQLPRVMEYLDGVLEQADCPMKAQMQIELAVVELFTNIAHYAYGDGDGSAEISVSVSGGVATITLTDSGVPYNPLEKDDPDVTLSAEDRQVGGLGIFLVKKNMDAVDYAYQDGHNRLTITKKFR